MSRNDAPLKNSVYSDLAPCYLQLSIGRSPARAKERSHVPHRFDLQNRPATALQIIWEVILQYHA